jgi:hypothetical protein
MNLHICINVVERFDDHFYGIKELIENEDSHKFIEINLDKGSFKLVNNVEYSTKKYYRAFFYKKIYKELEKKIHKEINAYPAEKVYLYISDEGVWAEIIKKIRDKLYKIIKKDFKIINIQHGYFESMFMPSEVGIGRIVRIVINHISTLIFGIPNFGRGFGQGGLDSYLVFTQKGKAFLDSQGNQEVFVAPNIIKSNFINRYRNFIKDIDENGIKKNILFAMPHFVSDPYWKTSLKDFLELVHPIFINLHNSGYKVLLRFHPGMKKEEWEYVLNKSKIGSFVSVDFERDVGKSIANNSYIFSINSTTLFEGFMVGKVPVQLNTNLLKTTLDYNHEIISLDKPLDQMQLDKVFNNLTIQKYKSMSLLENVIKNDLRKSLGLNEYV